MEGPIPQPRHLLVPLQELLLLLWTTEVPPTAGPGVAQAPEGEPQLRVRQITQPRQLLVFASLLLTEIIMPLLHHLLAVSRGLK